MIMHRFVPLIWLMMLIVALAACSQSTVSEGASPTAYTVSTLVPPAGITGQEILKSAQDVLHNATSFEAHQLEVWQRQDSRSENEASGKQADNNTGYIYSRHDKQVLEVVEVGGFRYDRGYFIGQDVGWDKRQTLPDRFSLQTLARALDDLEGPRIAGIEDVSGSSAYIIEGTAPIPMFFGGVDIWPEFEPGVYRLLVDMKTLAPVSLTYTGVSWIEHSGEVVLGGVADVTVTAEFWSINQPVSISAPPDDQVIDPNDPTPTPDPRFPATATPPR